MAPRDVQNGALKRRGIKFFHDNNLASLCGFCPVELNFFIGKRARHHAEIRACLCWVCLRDEGPVSSAGLLQGRRHWDTPRMVRREYAVVAREIAPWGWHRGG